MLSKWMGHATFEVTAIYANALGAEEHGIAARMWDQKLPYI
jgi:integrase/recombinase XerD